MPKRKAEAIWNGDLKSGNGHMKLQSGAYEGAYSFASRFEEGTGTNPEELIGGAHAGCFSMALAGELAEDGFSPEAIETQAEVNLQKSDEGFSIKSIHLNTRVTAQNIEENVLQKHAESAKDNCPVSRALSGVDVSVEASLN